MIGHKGARLRAGRHRRPQADRGAARHPGLPRPPRQDRQGLAARPPPAPQARLLSARLDAELSPDDSARKRCLFAPTRRESAACLRRLGVDASARGPADAVRLAAAPLGERGPLVGPPVAQRVARHGMAGVLAELLAGGADLRLRPGSGRAGSRPCAAPSRSAARSRCAARSRRCRARRCRTGRSGRGPPRCRGRPATRPRTARCWSSRRARATQEYHRAPRGRPARAVGVNHTVPQQAQPAVLEVPPANVGEARGHVGGDQPVHLRAVDREVLREAPT